ncbi:internal scaffolding protein [Sigmofec virus UA08Rod_5899]|uniref:Internal scaffolding protein n=1 Tax=Sigmofec virus UA08Rod_5899 TaxID=2929445 RepID=A0A976N172_9VIRU|nr:internal scaffolding protein [Sigmofec virus UA08Rod_5899]
MFKTQYDNHDRVYQNPGDPVKTLYGPIFDKNGVMSLKVTGKHDLYGEIQSHAESVDIHVLLQRYQNGDPGALARVQGAYGDFTQMPQTFAEALNTMIAAEQYFMGLPVETRSEFGHSFQQFIASMDAPDFSKRMGISPDVPAPSVPAAAFSPSPSDVPSSPAPAPAPAPESSV